MEYNPKYFKINEDIQSLTIAKEISFASIIYENLGRIEVSHNPVYVDIDSQKVFGHFAAKNPISKKIDQKEILLTFQGEHGLIKPEWYESDGHVPTWNYRVVHLRGKVNIKNDHVFLRSVLNRMGKLYKMENLFIPENLLNAISGFELDITEIEGKAKLNQHRAKEETKNIIEHLRLNGNKELADIMEKIN
ncbi:FMN-binding negative transcriptional regulator [Bacteriovoracaceae bacterium]|nr:FMN-binding negative transcriptional regulator [Bacteriovoracaceae bacterium]